MLHLRRFQFASFALLLTALLAAGCSSHDHHDNDGGARILGDIPRSAEVTDEGRGELGFRARRDGQYWIYDVERRRIDYSGTVHAGDRVEIRPDDNHILVNDQVVSDHDLKKSNEHRIYYNRD